ncbi:hypothetical protein AtubIFM54640_007750 [Aspergillus tubingensis]|uniref:F-box domain-containing protein n=1 Tax=Aspergillus niger TaxID=5061 RepID=A0A117E4N6_ASPNG|nr:inner centromere protein, ARK binding region family protein [Aspergillus tubingensis]GAQ47391.1 hypothetical protein AKAW_01230 [Aspergillus niger]GFN18615.1 inner centromere protein, ARK binding region family protein [Aspergillus tubingensis]GLA65566.1 hypothetical protein AtubIFM54640_007750 [Aspergillus tubingensis]
MSALTPQTSIHLPLEIQESIADYATANSKYHGKGHLRTLRQVSRSFCAAASRALFTNCTVYIEDSTNNSPFSDLNVLHQSNISQYIRTLIIECRPPWDHILTNPDIIQQWINLLSTTLPRLVRLRRLEYQTIKNGTPDQENLSRHFANLLVHCLEAYPPPFLQEIDFQHNSPQFYDCDNDTLYPATAQHIPHPVIARLRHIQLSYYSSASSLFEREPTAIFSLLRHARRLVSVELSGQMDGRNMTAKSCPSLVHPDAPLRSFTLENVSVSAKRLRGLRHFHKTLRHVAFRGVSLTAGTWEDVLSELGQLEGLVLLEVEMCGYEITAKMETERVGGLVPSSKIATSRCGDLTALELCVAAVKGHRSRIEYEAIPPVVDPFGRGVIVC